LEKHITSICLEISTAMTMKMAVFWVVAPCRLVWVYQLFTGLYCLHHQGDFHQRPDDGGSTDLWNVGKLIPVYTVLQPTRQPSSTYHLILQGRSENGGDIVLQNAYSHLLLLLLVVVLVVLVVLVVVVVVVSGITAVMGTSCRSYGSIAEVSANEEQVASLHIHSNHPHSTTTAIC
jgi:hypothetical protein